MIITCKIILFFDKTKKNVLFLAIYAIISHFKIPVQKIIWFIS